jgi:hypothetical protein
VVPSLQILRVPVPTAHPVTFRTLDRRCPPLYVVVQPSLQAVKFLAAQYHSAWPTHHLFRLLSAIVPRRTFSNAVANQSVLNKGDSHQIRVRRAYRVCISRTSEALTRSCPRLRPSSGRVSVPPPSESWSLSYPILRPSLRPISHAVMNRSVRRQPFALPPLQCTARLYVVFQRPRSSFLSGASLSPGSSFLTLNSPPCSGPLSCLRLCVAGWCRCLLWLISERRKRITCQDAPCPSRRCRSTHLSGFDCRCRAGAAGTGRTRRFARSPCMWAPAYATHCSLPNRPS